MGGGQVVNLQQVFTSFGLRQDSLHNVPRDIRQTEIAARVAEGEFGVVKAQQMQNGRVEIVDVHFVLSDLVSEVVGLPPC